jgi:hypothetical protein
MPKGLPFPVKQGSLHHMTMTPTEKHTTSHGSHDEALGHMGACCAAHTGTSGAKHEDKHKAANHRAGSSIVKKAMSMVKGGKDY